MFNHAPDNYICPICLGFQGIESTDTLLKQPDLVYSDAYVSAFINSFWVGRNEGHVILVPNQHFEHIYDMPTEVAEKILPVAQKIATAMKATYNCDGITIRQNNEPASEQHAFHFHLYVFPRYTDDNFNQNVLQPTRLSDPAERVAYSALLKKQLNQKDTDG